MPAVLQRLARHAHISTTMAYYVSISADEIRADLWAKHGTTDSTQGNILGNTTPKGDEKGLTVHDRKSYF